MDNSIDLSPDIAALHPGVALAMCAEIERLRVTVEQLEKEADG